MINFYKDNQGYVWASIAGVIISFYILYDVILNGNILINAWVTTATMLIFMISQGIFFAAAVALYHIENIKKCSCGVKK